MMAKSNVNRCRDMADGLGTTLPHRARYSSSCETSEPEKTQAIARRNTTSSLLWLRSNSQHRRHWKSCMLSKKRPVRRASGEVKLTASLAASSHRNAFLKSCSASRSPPASGRSTMAGAHLLNNRARLPMSEARSWNSLSMAFGPYDNAARPLRVGK